MLRWCRHKILIDDKIKSLKFEQDNFIKEKNNCDTKISRNNIKIKSYNNENNNMERDSITSEMKALLIKRKNIAQDKW